MNKILQDIQKKLPKTANDSSELFTGICFLTFKTQRECSLILDNWGVGFLTLQIYKYIKCTRKCIKGQKERIKGKVVYVSEPPEPLDILWENLGTPVGTLIKTRLATTFLSIILLGLGFGAILLMKYWQVSYLKENDNNWMKTYLSLGITFCISFVNACLGFTLRKITAKEKFQTMTAYNIGVTKRIAVVRIHSHFFIFFLENI